MIAVQISDEIEVGFRELERNEILDKWLFIVDHCDSVTLDTIQELTDTFYARVFRVTLK